MNDLFLLFAKNILIDSRDFPHKFSYWIKVIYAYCFSFSNSEKCEIIKCELNLIKNYSPSWLIDLKVLVNDMLSGPTELLSSSFKWWKLNINTKITHFA